MPTDKERKAEEERQKRLQNAAQLDLVSDGLMSQAMELKRIADNMRAEAEGNDD